MRCKVVDTEGQNFLDQLIHERCHVGLDIPLQIFKLIIKLGSNFYPI